MDALSQSGGSPGRIYYPPRRGVVVTATYLQVDQQRFAVRDLAAISRRRGGRRRGWQLWAYYQGRPTLLWASTDETEFGQVSRALLRAVEADLEQQSN